MPETNLATIRLNTPIDTVPHQRFLINVQEIGDLQSPQFRKCMDYTYTHQDSTVSCTAWGGDTSTNRLVNSLTHMRTVGNSSTQGIQQSTNVLYWACRSLLQTHVNVLSLRATWNQVCTKYRPNNKVGMLDLTILYPLSCTAQPCTYSILAPNNERH